MLISRSRRTEQAPAARAPMASRAVERSPAASTTTAPANPKAPTPSTSVIPLGPMLAKGLVPQGQGYDKTNSVVVSSFYQGPMTPGGTVNKPGTFLVVQRIDAKSDPVKTAGAAANVKLAGVAGGKAPAHVGGVACSADGRKYYVSDTHGVYVYDARKIRAGASPVAAESFTPVPRGEVKARDGSRLDASGSFMTIKGGYAYVGGYTKSPDGGALYRYPINKTTGALGNGEGPIRCPSRAQGMTPVKGGFLFATGGKQLQFVAVDTKRFEHAAGGQGITVGRLLPYAQGINVVGNQLLINYESGAKAYRGEQGTQAVQSIKLSDLELAGTGHSWDEWVNS